MQNLIVFISKTIKFIYNLITGKVDKVLTWFSLYSNNIQFEQFKSKGVPYISVALGGKCKIGNNFEMNNQVSSNPIGRNQPCILFVDKGASLIIGYHVGISATALVCHTSITIGNNVKIGGGVCIYDTDFHSLDSAVRLNSDLDHLNTIKEPVVIGNNTFIGAHSTILKGVHIGDNVIIGACSVVTKSIPANEIWAGNPAKFLRKIEVND